MFKNKDKKLFNLYMAYFIAMLFYVAVRIIANVGLFNGLNDNITSLIYTLLIQVGVMFLIPFGLFALFIRKNGGLKETAKSANIKKINAKVILISVLLGFVIIFVGYYVALIFNVIIAIFGFEFTQTVKEIGSPNYYQLVLDIILVGIFPGVFEELLHRGLILSQTSKLGARKAIFISSALFALVHFNIQQVSYAFVLGLILGLVTVISKSVIPAIIMHFINNAVNVYVGFASDHNLIFKDLFSWWISNDPLVSFITFMFVGLVVVSALALLIFLLFKECTINKVNNELKKAFGEKSHNEDENMARNLVLQELLKNSSTLNLEHHETSGVLDIVLPKEKDVYVMTLLDKAFLVGSVVMGALVTLFTFVWGVLW